MTTNSTRIATVIQYSVLLITFAPSGASQPTAANSVSHGATEFPVTIRHTITAGKTPVGAPVQAELVIATLASGIVIPRGAVLTGEVIQSAAKTKTEPSHLAIRFDSAQWKNGAAPLKVYLTAWYYPAATMQSVDAAYLPADAPNSSRTWNGQGAYPDPHNPASQQKFPGRDDGKDTDHGTSMPHSSISNHPTLLKHVESARSGDGVITLNSSSRNVKIDQATTYVLADSDVIPVK